MKKEEITFKDISIDLKRPSYDRCEYFDKINFSILKGKIIVDMHIEDESLFIKTADNKFYVMYHEQECFEEVYIESITEDYKEILIGNEILLAEEATNNKNPKKPLDEINDSFTWTFYKLATKDGYVDIRWYGASNGCYSETADFLEYIGQHKTIEEKRWNL